MRCKVGDLAVIVFSVAGHEGAVVQCLEYMGCLEWAMPHGVSLRDHTWRIDREFLSFDGVPMLYARDSQLRPVRDNDGEDEMLRIAGRPNETPREIIKRETESA